jgi:AbrB family looped-hinge helix DNA binding protein
LLVSYTPPDDIATIREKLRRRAFLETALVKHNPYSKAKARDVKGRGMTEETVRLSRKNQIVIPRGARKKLALSAGDELIVGVDEESLVIRPKPRSYAEYMQGLHKDVWRRTDVAAFVERERKDWSTGRRGSKRTSRDTRP